MNWNLLVEFSNIWIHFPLKWILCFDDLQNDWYIIDLKIIILINAGSTRNVPFAKIFRVVQTKAILFLKSITERGESDIERLWNLPAYLRSSSFPTGCLTWWSLSDSSDSIKETRIEFRSAVTFEQVESAIEIVLK